MGGIIPSMWLACQSASLHVNEIVQHARHTCITFVNSGNTLSSQSVPLVAARVWNRAATVELAVFFHELFHREWLAMSEVFGVVRKETFHELLYTTLPPHALTASDVLQKTLFVWFVLSGHVQIAPLKVHRLFLPIGNAA